ATGLNSGSTYQVEVTDYNGCKTTLNGVQVASNVSIEEELAAAGIDAITAYPNPTQGMLEIEIVLEKAEELSLSLFSPQGQLITKQAAGKVQQYQQQLDLSQLAAGVYLLQIATEQGTAFKRIVKE
ncbi:MAG: T9SS type A sorting domain-containing protein, partial [Bacteroidota bacterium]